MAPERRKVAVALLSVVSNSTLVILKIIVGFLIGSVSVVSEAIHSGVDLLASLIAFLAVRSSTHPADEEHPFGHGKIENISGAVEALLIFLAAGWIAYEAIEKIRYPHEIEAPFWGVAVMLVSVGANLIVSRMLFKVGHETDSVALLADAWHLRTDVWTSAGVMGGLALIAVGDRLAPSLGDRLHVIDPVAALVVACLIVKAAWHLTIQSSRDLLDVRLPDEERWIRELIKTFGPEVHGFHRMRTRKSGSTRFVDFHIFVSGTMTVDESHRLAHDISDRIRNHYEGTSVTVHVEPCNGQCGQGYCNGTLPGQRSPEDVGASAPKSISNSSFRQ